MTKRTLLVAMFALMATIGANAQIVNTLIIETRVDEQYAAVDGQENGAASGFMGKFLNFKMAGNLSDELSYSWRQRINKPQADGSMFNATDWIYLTYHKDNWNLSAGKQVVAIGGYEYDRAPIDIYFASEYWQHIACYQFGMSAGYAFGEDGADNLTFQICQSPLGNRADNLMAYNLMWCGSHGSWKTIYSLNLLESAPGELVNYIALGNRFGLGDVVVELDFMNRSMVDDMTLLKNFSVVADVNWSVYEKMNVFGKVSYDQNDTNLVTDSCVLPGSKLTRLGGGFEYFPMGANRNLRIHVAADYITGESLMSALKPNSYMFSMGLTWRLNLLK